MHPQPRPEIPPSLISCKVESPQSRDPDLYQGAIALEFERAEELPFLLLSVRGQPPEGTVLTTDEECRASGTLRKGRIVLNQPNPGIAVDRVTVEHRATGKKYIAQVGRHVGPIIPLEFSEA